MLQAVGYKLIDPFGKAQPREVGGVKEVEQACRKLVRQVVEYNQANGKKDLFGVCVIHRTKPIHRWFNVAWSDGPEDFRPETYNFPSYAGAQSHLESLLSGEWKIATPQEEEACKKKDDDERLAALAAADKRQAAGSMAAGEAMAKAFTASIAAKNPEPKGK